MIYFNSRQPFFKKPFGAVTAGSSVTLQLLLPKEWQQPTPQLLVYYADQWEEPAWTVPMQLVHRKNHDSCYQCKFTPPEPSLLYYRFQIKTGETLRSIGKGAESNGELDNSYCWQLTVYDSSFHTPKAFHGGIIYQIFPDRFANSGTPKQNVPTDRLMHKNWNEEPVGKPYPDGSFPCNDFFGGDLEGIRQKLPYLASLGVESIYLNPIFESHSNHRYNTANYERIDPLLGTEEDFKRLCQDAKTYGIKVILDGVFNHTGSDSIYFNKEGRYGKNAGAYRNPRSQYRDWFLWKDYQKRTYFSWWGFVTLPDVNEQSPTYRKFICGRNGVIRKWLRAGASGFRLDVADELPDDFIEDIRHAVKLEGKENLLMGEVWEDASNKWSSNHRRKYFQGFELDTVMNYPWRTAIIDFVRDGKGAALKESILTILENYPAPVIPVLMNCLSTHDVPRAITALAAESKEGKDREWQRQHNQLDIFTFLAGRQMLILASVIQYTLPGCPSLYYGDEAALYGYADPFNRGTYPWDKPDTSLVDFFKMLGQLRKNSPALRGGSFTPLLFTDDQCAYLRTLGEETILVCVNRSRGEHPVPKYPGKAEILLPIGGASPDKTMMPGHSAFIAKLTELPAKTPSQREKEGIFTY